MVERCSNGASLCRAFGVAGLQPNKREQPGTVPHLLTSPRLSLGSPAGHGSHHSSVQ